MSLKKNSIVLSQLAKKYRPINIYKTVCPEKHLALIDVELGCRSYFVKLFLNSNTAFSETLKGSFLETPVCMTK